MMKTVLIAFCVYMFGLRTAMRFSVKKEIEAEKARNKAFKSINRMGMKF